LPFLDNPPESGKYERLLSKITIMTKLRPTIAELRDLNENNTRIHKVFRTDRKKKLESEMKNKEKWAAVGRAVSKYSTRNQKPSRLLERFYRDAQGRKLLKTQGKIDGHSIRRDGTFNNIISDFPDLFQT